MRALLVPVAFAAALSAAPAAFAANATMDTTGSVKSISLKAHKLTLKDGSVYRLPADFKDPGLEAGEKVKVSWTMDKGRHNATDVEIVK